MSKPLNAAGDAGGPGAPITHEERLALVVVIGVGLLVRALLALRTEAYADTAYYWAWAQQLAWSYFDHPAGVALLIRAVGVPGSIVALSIGTIAAPAALGASLGGPATALRAAALGAVTPFFVLASVMVGPDGGLVVAGSLSLAFAIRGRLAPSALALAVAMLFKYPAVLLAVPVLAAAWPHLRRARAATAIALACSGALPTLLWNAQHDFEGLKYQAHHGLGSTLSGARVGLELVASQFGMVGPVAFPLALWWLARGAEAERATRCAAAVPWALFLGLGFFSRGEANWPAMAALAAVPGVASWCRNRPRALWWAIGTSSAVSLAGLVFLTLPTPWTPASDPIKRLHGHSALDGFANAPAAAVFASNYVLGGQLSMRTGKPVGVISARRSQFDVWGPPPLQPGDDALWVSEGEGPPDSLALQFTQIEALEPREGRFGQVLTHTFTAWRLIGWRADGT